LVKIDIPYGKSGSISINIPDENIDFVSDLGDIPELKDPAKEIKACLKSPTGTLPLSDLVDPKQKVVIVGDDITRPTPQNLIMPILLDELNEIGIPDKNIEIIIALGTHRPMTKKEIKEKYGNEIVKRVRVTNHDYKNLENLVSIGRTESGIPIRVNKKVFNADFVVGVGNIAPHALAGWSGGGKIILPGVCGEETTEMTHVIAGKVRPISKLFGRLDNKIRKEIDEVALKAGLKFIVNVILNRDGRIGHVVAGDPVKAYREGVKTARKIYCPEVPRYVDVMITTSYPSDIDYWQAIDSLAYASTAVKEGGTIIIATPCPEGISAAHPLLRKRATLGYEENLKAIENKEFDDLVAGGALLLHAQILERAEVICYSHGLSKDDKSALGFKHAKTMDKAVAMAFESQGKKARVGVLKHGKILPILRRSAI
jgi:nickel-dependent lactate racemase